MELPAASGNYALRGLLRGTQVVGSLSYAYVAPLSGSLATSYGGVLSFRMLYRRFTLYTGSAFPRTVRVVIVSRSGLTASIVARDASAPLAPNTWLQVSLPLSESAWTLSVATANAAEKRMVFLRILGAVQRCVSIKCFVCIKFFFLFVYPWSAL